MMKGLNLLLLLTVFSMCSCSSQMDKYKNINQNEIVLDHLLVGFYEGTELEEVNCCFERNSLDNYKELTNYYETNTYQEKKPIFLVVIDEPSFEVLVNTKEQLEKEEIIWCVDFDGIYHLD